MKPPYKSHATAYWFGWLAVLLVFLIVRFSLRQHAVPSSFFGPYILTVWLPIMALNFYEGRRLMSYLRIHHTAKWNYLTTVPGFGPGCRNGFRSLPWLRSDDTLGDPTVATLKSSYRSLLALAITFMLTLPIALFLLSR